MSHFRYLTAGESHGKCLTAIIEGLPSGLFIDIDFINEELSKRQQGYGRSERMQIETDKVEITSGIYILGIRCATYRLTMEHLQRHTLELVATLDCKYFVSRNHIYTNVQKNPEDCTSSRFLFTTPPQSSAHA